MKTIMSIIILLTAFALAIGYNLWLNAGCDEFGVMTWHGKECLVIKE